MSNPFKDSKELTRDIENYLRKNNNTIFNQSKRISDFFEMACYNNIVRFYENTGYIVTIKNTIKNKFRYKCTTAGDPNNYSYFEIKPKIGIGNLFEIRHNVNVQSFHKDDIYTTPDISIIKENGLSISNSFYTSKAVYHFVPNTSLISFCECKNLNAFPELLFNFIGVVNELKPNLMKKKKRHTKDHIAPSLLLSGGANTHAERIILDLQRRYHINVLCDLFNIGGAVFKYSVRKMQKI